MRACGRAPARGSGPLARLLLLTILNTKFVVSDSSGGPLFIHQRTPLSTGYAIPVLESRNALVTLLGLRVFMGGVYYLLSGGSHACSPFCVC
ncbi:hypothetical protein EVAR_86764_1 [Eumeta japonica]|uniref:Uncharacterized protein n=1 Tax=Eumeta variegata TaxID=151549 RepID=A0A4C1W112_EUMVA|nr:hypothetical protein EVAR_86764_1 [Eumeta japonica]